MGINTKYNHDNLDGSDCISYYITDYDAYMNSLEHTLTKSGIAWIIDHTHTLFGEEYRVYQSQVPMLIPNRIPASR